MSMMTYLWCRCCAGVGGSSIAVDYSHLTLGTRLAACVWVCVLLVPCIWLCIVCTKCMSGVCACVIFVPCVWLILMFLSVCVLYEWCVYTMCTLLYECVCVCVCTICLTGRVDCDSVNACDKLWLCVPLIPCVYTLLPDCVCVCDWPRSFVCVRDWPILCECVCVCVTDRDCVFACVRASVCLEWVVLTHSPA